MTAEIKKDNGEIPDMLVSAIPWFINDQEKWKYKWDGFCFGKRFSVIQNPYEKELVIDIENNTYVFSKLSDEKYLPPEIIPIIYGVPLSNYYFIEGKRRHITVEAVMQLIEAGYNIANIEAHKYSRTNVEKYMCRYYDKATGVLLIEVTSDGIIHWKVPR